MTIKEGQERLAEAMLRPVNPTAIILLGVFTVVWGFWVGNPFWDIFPGRPLYSFMQFMPEAVWGLLATAVGVVISHGAFTRTLPSLILGARVGGIYWFVVSLMLFIGDWQSTGGINAMVLAVYSAFIYVNLKVNHAHVEHENELFTH